MKSLKIILSGLILIAALSSCKVYAPVYKRIDNFRMVKLDREGFKIYGDIIMYNPNKMGVKLNDMLMNIELNDKHVATAGQKEPVPIKAKSEFAVPLNLTVKPDMTLTEGLTNVINIIKTREMKVTVNGVIVVKAFGVKLSIPIKQDEKVDLTKLK